LVDVKSIGNPRIAKRAVAAILADLESLTQSYLTKDLPEHFRRGFAEAATSLQKVLEKVDESFGPVQKEALQQLLDDSALKFATALEGYAGNHLDSSVPQRSRRFSRSSLWGGNPWGQQTCRTSKSCAGRARHSVDQKCHKEADT
jgi:hypothetical protein